MGDGGSIPTSALQLRIEPISRYLARELNSLWHSTLPAYETGFLLNATVCYAALYRETVYAVAIWANPVARSLPQTEWLELRRFAIALDAPRNTGSRMLAVMARLIRRSFPATMRLISYQDMEAHTGTIYKAAGWSEALVTVGGTWDRPNSHNLNGTPRTRPDLNKATGPKRRWELAIGQKKSERLQRA